MNPLEPAADAIVLDTSDRTVDDTLRAAIAVVRDRMPELARLTAQLPKVAVVGRQNVGKSTLVNRLFGRRETIADEHARRHARPGRGRDRRGAAGGSA